MTERKTILQLDKAAGSSATVGDTGGPIFGSIDQVAWISDASDTGPRAIGTFQLVLMPKFSTDTGLGYLVWGEGSLVSANKIHRVPRQRIHTQGGGVIDTGDDFSEAVYAAGDSIRAKFVSADTGLVAGELHVWHGSRGGLGEL